MHKPRICKILKVENEAENIKTVYFKDRMISSRIIPGQFIMVWIPGVDEIPMGVSHIGLNSELAITVEAVGEATERLCSLKEGDFIGVRGPYGRGFSPPGLSNLIIGGGTGMAPLMPLIEHCVREKVKVNVLLGGGSLSKTPFIKKLKNILNTQLECFKVTTEDGSYGCKGLVTDLLDEVLLKNSFERVYACGPELMLKKIYEYSLERRLPLEVSLERYIKCGIGICGSCYIGPYRICVEGPVFKINELEKIRNILGEWTRDSSGRLIPLK
ncbi:MAG: dihydroorotate dehydrogenase electron transfer subunit [Candidatus Odinarchaeum yellowstonii]|uniref:Probable dihydroorotate dehydrogenase B (NAD(+)), electron transfer subunit n=1 Tax=Odinarchaeota yellowstonii (strain LCB_4) TaxID=1841599 RepID=A0AAF0IBQ5_ODILC|nr:MAG: dihydroorotate dehydrogenase electron transfer subunit [Candidatus Odinarchaeum yellowstonii]